MKIAIMIVSMMFLFTACTGGGNDGPVLSSPWLGGSRALEVNFLEGEPPTELLDAGEDSFSIGVEVQNMGEDVIEVGEAIFKLKGVPAIDLGVTPEDLIQVPDEVIDARRKSTDTGNAIESPSVFINFEDLTYVPNLAGNLNREFFVEACYIYDTQATADLCVKENLRDTEDDKVCTIAGTKEYANSGAPVQVTNFREYGRGEDTVGFSFQISHVGLEGSLYKVGTGCLDIPQNENLVEVRVSAPSYPFDGLTCSGLQDKRSEDGWPVVGTKSIKGGPSEVNCELTIPAGQRVDGVSNIDILLSYDYAQTVQKTVLIKSFD